MTKKIDENKLTMRQRLRAIKVIIVTIWQVSPIIALLQGVGIVLNSVFPLLTAYFAGQTTTALADAYNGVSGSGDKALWFIALTAGVGLLMILWRAVSSYIDEMARYKLEAAVTDRLFTHYSKINFEQYESKTNADIMERAMRMRYETDWIFRRITGIFESLSTLIFSGVALALVHPIIAVVLLIASAPAFAVQFRLSKIRIEHWVDRTNTTRRKNLLEMLMSQLNVITEIRTMGIFPSLFKKYHTYRDSYELERLGFERKYIKYRFAANTLDDLVQLGVLIYIALQIIARKMPIGQFVFIQSVMERYINAVSSIVVDISRMDEELAIVREYEKFFTIPTTHSNRKAMDFYPDTFGVKDITFHYPYSDKVVLKNVSLTIPTGQHVAIVGENGAGKSTLLKILLGIYIPQKGEVFVDGHLLNEYIPESWHAHLSVLQQDFTKFNFTTLRDNVIFGDATRKFDKQHYEAALERAQCTEFIDKLPNGDKTILNKRMESDDGESGVELSGGQWQRVAMARAFYRDSPIIILDEPTSAIDAVAEAKIFKELYARKDRTVIAVSHRLSTVKRADVIYMMEGGRIVEQGTYDELVKLRGAFYEMFREQM